MISARQIYKSFESLRVLDGISFTVSSGEFVSIFGPSGCGKTTLLRILAGLERPDRGTIRLKDIDAHERPEEYIARLSFVWQDHRLLPWRSVLSNVVLALELRGERRARKEIVERAEEAIRFVGLESARHLLPRALSGGMRQRINLARALCLDSDVMLMDEPLASLNEVTDKRTLMEKIAQLWQVKRKTIVYVTHSLAEALFLADRIIVVSEKPAKILDSIPVPLPHPRGSEDLSRTEVEEIRRRVSGLLRGDLV